MAEIYMGSPVAPEERHSFVGISIEEFVLLDSYHVKQGIQREEVVRGTASEAAAYDVIDESTHVASLCSEVKWLAGDDVTRGFADSVHVLKFVNELCNLPDPRPDDQQGDTPVLIAA